jgi:hypothetical protein
MLDVIASYTVNAMNREQLIAACDRNGSDWLRGKSELHGDLLGIFSASDYAIACRLMCV